MLFGSPAHRITISDTAGLFLTSLQSPAQPLTSDTPLATMKLSIAFLAAALVLASTLGETRPLPSSRGGFRLGSGASRSEQPAPARRPSSVSSVAPSHGAATEQGDDTTTTGASGGADGTDAGADGANRKPASGGFGGVMAWLKGNGDKKQLLDNAAAGINTVALPFALSGHFMGANMAAQNQHDASQSQSSADAANSSASTTSTAPSSSSTASSPAVPQYQRRSGRGGAGRSGSVSRIPSSGGGSAGSAGIRHPLEQGSSSNAGSQTAPSRPSGHAGPDTATLDPPSEVVPSSDASGASGSQTSADAGQSHNPGGLAAGSQHSPTDAPVTTSNPNQPQSLSQGIPASSSLGLLNAVGNLLGTGLGTGVTSTNQHAATEMDHAKHEQQQQQQQQQQQAAAPSNSTASNSTSTAAPAAATSRAVGWDFGLPAGLVA